MAKANSFQHISIMGVKVLARLAAKRAVQAQLKEQGVRVSTYPYAELMRQAHDYLAQHPELYDQAKPRVDRMIAEGVFGKRVQRAYLNSSAQTQEQRKSMGSTVQMLGAK